MAASAGPALATVLDLARARTVILRDVDAEIAMHHGIGLSDLGLLLELLNAPEHRMRRVDLANRLGVTTSGVARQLTPLSGSAWSVASRAPATRGSRSSC